MAIQKRERTTEPRVPFLENTLRTAFPGHLNFKGKCEEVGLEIECEGKNLFNAPINWWKAVTDHSLRAVDGHPPLEYVLRKPIKRSEVNMALSYLHDQLKACKSSLKMSHRTSVHVHLNCQDMRMMDILNFICLYLIMEDMLVDYSGPDRKGNLFCLRAKDAEYQTEVLAAAIRSYNFGNAFNNNYRYSACNLAALQAHGSLEFRTMRGNVDVDLINSWVELLLAIKDRACEFKNPGEIGDLFTKLGPRKFIESVFEKRISIHTMNWFLMNDKLHEYMWASFRAMRDVAYAINWSKPPKGDRGIIANLSFEDGDEDDDED